MRTAYLKPGWAILVTYGDGSSAFHSAKGTNFPKIWAYFARSGAVQEMKKLRDEPPILPGKRTYRVVKIKATWPEIL